MPLCGMTERGGSPRRGHEQRPHPAQNFFAFMLYNAIVVKYNRRVTHIELF